MTLFTGIQRQATDLIGQLAGGRVDIASSPGKLELLHQIAAQVSNPVVLHISSHPDAHLHVLLSVAAQCNVGVLGKVATMLRDRAPLEEPIDVLRKETYGRLLLVSDLDLLSAGIDSARGGTANLADVFSVPRAVVHKWVADRAKVATYASASASTASVVAHAGSPKPSDRWDSVEIWSRCRGDLDLFTVAAARTLISGVDPLDSTLTWSLENAILDLWVSLSRPLRELMEMLVIHDRPVPRELLSQFPGVDAPTIDAARQGLLIDEIGGSLVLAPFWTRSSALIARIEPSAVHRKIAQGLETLADDESLGGIAVLEVHRHYAAVPDLQRARSYARYGSEMLLEMARRQSLRSQFGPACKTYEAVLALDAELRSSGTPSMPRARAYAIHYLAYNRYRASYGDSIDITIDKYREALADWPQNALFWSRLISAYAITQRFEDVVRAFHQAYELVPEHRDRDRVLVGRTVEKLLDRRLAVAAAIAWGNRSANVTYWIELRKRLLDTWQGRPSGALWTPRWGRVELDTRVDRKIRVRNERFELEILGHTASSDSLLSALDEVIAALVAEVQQLLWRTGPNENERHRRDELVKAIIFDRAAPNEKIRWTAFLADLFREGRALVGERVVMTICGLRARVANLRLPTARVLDDDTIQLAWSFGDRPGLVFTLDIEGSESAHWFFRDASSAEVLASEQPGDPIPDELWARLEAFAR